MEVNGLVISVQTEFTFLVNCPFNDCVYYLVVVYFQPHIYVKTLLNVPEKNKACLDLNIDEKRTEHV